MEISLPDFFVIGVPKSGSTSLFKLLSSNNQFHSPKIKEPHFLIQDNKNYIISINNERKKIYNISYEEYKELYSGKKFNQITGDFSTHYFYHIELFIENLKKIYGDRAKRIPIILILRNPVDRAKSHYSMKVRDGKENLSFSESISKECIKRRIKEGYISSFDYLGHSCYEKNLIKLKEFSENLLVIKYEFFIENKSESLNVIGSFLNFREPIQQQTLKRYNLSGSPKKDLLSKSLHYLFYRGNIIKSYIPMRFRTLLSQKVGIEIKRIIGPYILEELKINKEELSALNSILKSEIEYFNELDNYGIKN